MIKKLFTLSLLGIGLFFGQNLQASFSLPEKQPNVLVLYDGPADPKSPGKIDALSVATLLGHFTTRRTVIPLEQYQAGDWKSYDAIFCIIYSKKYDVPRAFLQDAANINKPFCWLGQQAGQMDQYKGLSDRGIKFEKLWIDAPIRTVIYKNAVLGKGDPDTNIYKVVSPNVNVVAVASGTTSFSTPYILNNGSFWIVADSPYSYADENDRYMVFADLLHDILKVDHQESHQAMIRIEDLNAMSNPAQLSAILRVLKKQDIPFSFGFVPFYVKPDERLYIHLWEKPEVLKILKEYVRGGGTPVLHGYTHQYRGVSTDDYEFWDDLRDRPVRGDSQQFVQRRLDSAIKDSVFAGLFPVTWETPHYAASQIDYSTFKKFFETANERAMVADQLGSDPLLPYPVIDLHGRLIIPESLSYIPEGKKDPSLLIRNATSLLVVRDGYAAGFFHPFLDPQILNDLIKGLKNLGYTFKDLKEFPNLTKTDGVLITNKPGSYSVGGVGRFINETILSASGRVRFEKTTEVSGETNFKVEVELKPGETYIALRQNEKPSTWVQKLVRLAKGDVDVISNRNEFSFGRHSPQDQVDTILLWNSKATGKEAVDQNAFYNTLEVSGFDVEKVECQNFVKEDQDLKPFSILVVPHASAKTLPSDDIERILKEVSSGVFLVTDGDGPLADALGMKFSVPSPVKFIGSQTQRNEDLRWPDQPLEPTLSQPLNQSDLVYYVNRENGRPLSLGGFYGQGHYLFFAPLFDPTNSDGYSRFPDFPHILMNELGLTPSVRRQGADAYFDPGYRQNISIERLGKMWRRSGIRAIHVAAWHFYDKYSYDYARLIKVAHQNGILVYAWFEWPHVSERFWNQHPEWREKTGIHTDARVDWRYPMNFQNPKCLEAVLKDVEKLLKSNEWDGINIAEFNFDGASPERPDLFTPFNDDARRDFQKKNGFDLFHLFDKDSNNYWKTNNSALQLFYAYRRDLNHSLLEQILGSLRKWDDQNKKDLEIIVTSLDALTHPDLSDQLGIDMKAVIRLVNKYNATLQVEDPAKDWSKEPSRYTTMGELYHKMGLKKPFMIDINVLPVHPETQKGFASNQPTGTELFHLWRTSSKQATRVGLYSEASIYDSDWQSIPYAMASEARVVKEGESFIVETPQTVTLELGRSVKKINVDEKPWGCLDRGDILLPPGEHKVTVPHNQRYWFDATQLETQLLGLSGELLGCQSKNRGIEIEYESPSRCVMLFNKAPTKIYVDGNSVSLPILRGDAGFSVVGPSGQHRIRVLSQSVFHYIVEFTGWISASIIVLFGVASTGLLALLFIVIVLRRRFKALKASIRKRLSRNQRG